jgi:hypothetical protein
MRVVANRALRFGWLVGLAACLSSRPPAALDLSPPNSSADFSAARDASIVDAAEKADAALATELIVWNGDAYDTGASWATPSSNAVSVQSAVARSGQALKWIVPAQSNPWSEWGWNWKSFQPPGTQVAGAIAYTFYMKLSGNHIPSDFVISLRSAITKKYAHQPPPTGGLRGVSLKEYAPTFADGAWHAVSVPMADMLSADSASDFSQIYEMYIGAAGSDYTLYLDDLAFTF